MAKRGRHKKIAKVLNKLFPFEIILVISAVVAVFCTDDNVINTIATGIASVTFITILFYGIFCYPQD